MPEFTPAPVKAQVPFSVLESIDVRLGTIERVEDVPGSKKLVKLVVSFGDHTRNILAGLKTDGEARSCHYRCQGAVVPR